MLMCEIKGLARQNSFLEKLKIGDVFKCIKPAFNVKRYNGKDSIFNDLGYNFGFGEKIKILDFFLNDEYKIQIVFQSLSHKTNGGKYGLRKCKMSLEKFKNYFQ